MCPFVHVFQAAKRLLGVNDPVSLHFSQIGRGGDILPLQTVVRNLYLIAQDNPCAIGLLKTERDRLAGLRPSGKNPGYVLTRPFDPHGKRLLVNARISGELRAELRVGNDKTVEGWALTDCDPAHESGFAQELTWRGRSLGDCGLNEAQIRFELRDAELFAFDFGKRR
jgi:hypothetical protein